MLVKIDAEKLKQFREQRCWSQQQLAEMSGISLRTVQRIEAKAVASQESVKSLAAVFDIDTQTILAREETSQNLNDVAAPQSNAPVGEPLVAPDKKRQSRAFRTLYLSYGLVFVTHLIAFFCIFAAFEQHEITQETFQLLKNTVSIALVLSALALLWRDRQLKRKFRNGSSLY